LQAVQRRNRINADRGAQANLDMDFGLPLEIEGIPPLTVEYPSFTVEMETGTGKTYVYYRTMFELFRECGFTKFVIVIPSRAIYEGVAKSHELTREHFASLYGNLRPSLIRYEGTRLSDLRSFAASTSLVILLITLDAFSGQKNVIYRASDALPGELLPVQYVSKTRPILILDEPQNMGSERSKQALRSLDPLFSLRYSATHRENPNQVYRLSPFIAFQSDLVKRIQVAGFSLASDAAGDQLEIVSMRPASGTAVVMAAKREQGRKVRQEVTIHQNDDLQEKTKNSAYEGFVVDNIDFLSKAIVFRNGEVLTTETTSYTDTESLFREMIRETISAHFRRQARLKPKNIKVLSLFFIDRVENYLHETKGFIRKIFDEEFDNLKRGMAGFVKHLAEEVRASYFASKKRPKSGELVWLDDLDTADAREAEKEAYALIMRDKERLLSFDTPVSFIFAHSALREGWDNPNVFQICTLNSRKSDIARRQEIGRGLRLPVTQEGNRVQERATNVLTVVASESYASYVSALQREYAEAGETETIKVGNARRPPVRRRNAVYGSPEFRHFWEALEKTARYEINIKTDELVREVVDYINAKVEFPLPRVVRQRGDFGFLKVKLEALEAKDSKGAGKRGMKFRIGFEDTRKIVLLSEPIEILVWEGDAFISHIPRPELKGLFLKEVQGSKMDAIAVLTNGWQIGCGESREVTIVAAEADDAEEKRSAQAKAPIPNIVDIAARETGITRTTAQRIFFGIVAVKKECLFANPDGFANTLVKTVRDCLSDHIATHIEFRLDGKDKGIWFDNTLGGVAEQIAAYGNPDSYFPDPKEHVESELVFTGEKCLYEAVHIDSNVERTFLQERLESDPEVILYFKFPSNYRINLPRIVGNYNPDWGIVRRDKDGYKLELVRETKGREDLTQLRFDAEKRKIVCAQKYFRALGIDYKTVSERNPNWWKRSEKEYQIL
jgi:type III restriction enzyme